MPLRNYSLTHPPVSQHKNKARQAY